MTPELEDIRDLPTQYEDHSDSLVPRIMVFGEGKFLVGYLTNEFASKGYVIDHVLDPAYAEVKLQQFFYKLIFCDLGSQNPADNPFFEYCRTYCSFSKLILITDGKDINASVAAMKSGVSDVLIKPIALDKLKQIVVDAVNTERDNVKAIAIEPPDGYRIIRQISSGSFGSFCAVMLGEKDGKYYAIKILSRNLYSMERLKRFFREAGILSKIQHPNIVQIFEYGFSEKSEVPYISMEYLQGKRLSEFTAGNVPLPLDVGVKILKQLLSALSVVHEHGILHRDIKPHNVIVDSDFTVKLTDFGAAHVEESNLTMTSSMLGSPTYMSPESFDNIKDADERTDIFSMGVVAYEFFTGHLPFTGRTIPGVANAVKKAKPVEPRKLNPKIPYGIEKILAKMLKKNPDKRYTSASEILKDLDDYDIKKYFIRRDFKNRLISFLHLSPDWS